MCLTSIVGTLMGSNYRNSEVVVFAGIGSVISFVLAFMIDDLRHFIWRQVCLGHFLRGQRGRPKNAPAVIHRSHSWRCGRPWR